MQYQSVSDIRARYSAADLVQFDERDPCYTWLYPLSWRI